jgi:hypothetical protein
LSLVLRAEDHALVRQNAKFREPLKELRRDGCQTAQAARAFLRS